MAGSGDGTSDPHVSGARRRLEAVREALLREMTLRLSHLNQKGGELVGERDALDNARRIRTQVLTLLREDGLPVVIGAAEAAIADAVDSALRSHVTMKASAGTGAAGVSMSFDADAKDSIARSVSGVLDEVAGVFADAGAQIREAIDVGLSTGSSLVDVTDKVAKALDVSFKKAGVAVETAIRMAARTALVTQAERGSEAIGEEMVYLWLGPVDSKTRPLCRENAGRAFTLDALKGMENESGLPVESSAGGWSCRHVLSPLLRSTAEQEGIEVVDG